MWGSRGSRKNSQGFIGGKAFELKRLFQGEMSTFDDRDNIKKKNIAELENRDYVVGQELRIMPNKTESI